VLGADVIMAFDECPPGGCDRQTAERANRRTLAWLERCRARFEALEAEGMGGALAATPGLTVGPGGMVPDVNGGAAALEGPVPPQALFPVLQGNVYPDLRVEHARAVRDMGDWVGYGIGGLSVGEAKEKMWATLEALHPELPEDRPRYLMGVGYPDDLLEAIERGCEMFDCVAPTRNARHGTAWTPGGQVNLKAARFRSDRGPSTSVRLPGLHPLRPGLPAPHGGVGRGLRAPPHLDPQPALPRAAGRGGAAAHSGGDVPELGRRLETRYRGG
jgi:queuine tRNA-ribosyltransferase